MIRKNISVAVTVALAALTFTACSSDPEIEYKVVGGISEPTRVWNEVVETPTDEETSEETTEEDTETTADGSMTSMYDTELTEEEKALYAEIDEGLNSNEVDDVEIVEVLDKDMKVIKNASIMSKDTTASHRMQTISGDSGLVYHVTGKTSNDWYEVKVDEATIGYIPCKYMEDIETTAETNTQPETNNTQPESNNTQPESNNTQPESNNTQPESNNTPSSDHNYEYTAPSGLTLEEQEQLIEDLGGFG